ncbi:MAG: sulfite exporter TauE/SafE family protein [Candidatus Glassbacteria bacterium]|nr:sulfite exporter TauE/SafE family protein [Candidatus Glassbacteria bacterium]
MRQNSGTNSTAIKFAVLLLILAVILAGLFSAPSSGAGGRGATGFLHSVVVGDITGHEVVNLFLLGFISGVVGGMLGMGGGVLKVVNLHLLLGFGIIFARIVSLLSYVVISLSAFFRYRKYRLILWDVVKLLIPAAILGALVGAIIGSWINKEVVEIIVGVYAMLAGIIVLNQIWANPDEKVMTEFSSNDINEATAAGIGAAMGVISSLIGISGGIISTPLQNSLLKVPLKNSIANTITVAVFCSIFASGFLLFQGLRAGDFVFEEVMFVTVCLIPGNILGAQLGGYLTNRLQLNYIRAAFGIIAFVIGFKILLRH